MAGQHAWGGIPDTLVIGSLSPSTLGHRTGAPIELLLVLAQRTNCACREARTKLSRRPWRVDTFDELAQKWFSCSNAEALPDDGVPHSPFRRVIMFVDNAGELAIRLQKALLSVPGQPALCKS